MFLKKSIQITAMIAILLIAVLCVASVGYGLYQQSQLYPSVHQQLGYQQCVLQVQAAQQSNLQMNEE